MITLQETTEKGIRLSVENDNIRVTAPKGSLSSDIVDFIRTNKESLISQLRREQDSASKPSEGNIARTYNILYKIWTPAVGRIGRRISFDTETEPLIEGDRVFIPRLVLATAKSRKGCYIIPLEHVRAFLLMHKKAIIILHNAAFDRKVIKKFCGIDLRYWLERGRLADTFFLYQLMILAENGYVPQYPSLEFLAEELSGIILNKDEKIRLGFGQFLSADGTVNISIIPHKFLQYAAEDAHATFEVFLVLIERIQAICSKNGISPPSSLSHDIQVKASFALDEITRNGMRLEPSRINEMKENLEERKIDLLVELGSDYGWSPGEGSATIYQSIMTEIELEMGIRIPRTEGGDISGKEEDLDEIAHPFVKLYLEYREVEKWLSTFLNRLSGRNVVNAAFSVLMRTGRTSCYGPNLQQLPRKKGIREAFVPSQGFYFEVFDYKFLELCSLASECLARFGESKLAEIINSGRDPHRWLAAQILKILEADVTDEDRSKAKAVAFGFPGGLGDKAFVKYAKANYGIVFTEAEAAELREKWLCAFPEMRKYMESVQDGVIIEKFNLASNPIGWSLECMPGVFRRIVSGNPVKASNGDPYPEELVSWIWDNVKSTDFINKKKFTKEIAECKGSKKLATAIFSTDTVILRSGRIRSNCSYCQARNTPFQGTAADGAKLALYRLVREKYRIVNMIHDEVILEVPIDADHLALAHQVECIMIEEMAKMIPDVKIGVEFALMDRWHKGAKARLDPDNPTKLLLWHPE